MAYRTHIHNLDNDSLLQIFSCYRLDDDDDWYFLLTWRKLTHVCRRWRFLIYDSSFHLDLCLLLTNDSPSIYTPSHLPPLPLVIYHSDRTRTMARKGEDNVYLGLQQNGRIRRVVLQAPSSSLRVWIEPISKLFPILVDLSLLSTNTEETNLMLPETFQAPDLRRLSLHGVGLPAGLPLLSSAIALSTLSLTCIGASCYFTPRHLVTKLQGLPHLEELSIGFAIPIPLPNKERKLLPAPIPPVTLPALRQLTFRGVDTYFDNLIAQIDAPLLKQLSLTLLFDLTFTLVNLTEYIHRTEDFGCLIAQVIFNKDGPSLDMGHYEGHDIGKLSLRVNCEPLDWQIDCITRVCKILGKVVSTVEELKLDLNADGMPSDWEYALDSIMWHELLQPFVGVKKLNIGSSLTRELSQALQSFDGVPELLPDLQELGVQLKDPFSLFAKYRESVGRAVHLSVWPVKLPRPGDILPPLPEIRSEQIRQRIFTHRSQVMGNGYVFQAPESDAPLDNEELEHLGDQVFALAVTDLIQELYPRLRVGPASGVRDRIKRKARLAEICMSYELHTRLNASRHQVEADILRLSQNVLVGVFKAYVGGVYKDQGAEVVSEWLRSLLRPHVEVAYQIVRGEHLLPSETETQPQLDYFAGSPRDHRRLTGTPPEASVPQQSSAQAGDGIGTRRAETRKPRRRRRRRRSSTGADRSGDADGTLPRRHSSTGLGSTDSARKRLRAEGRNDG